MKTHYMMISRQFPKTHPRAGEPTGFKEKIFAHEKLHTILMNPTTWSKRIREVHRGEAFLSLREWSGEPYKSKQVEFKRLTLADGLSFQSCGIPGYWVQDNDILVGPESWKRELIASNDGLKIEDFNAWFLKPAPNCILIHFTDFRYRF